MSPVHPASRQLVAFAVEVRPDWDPDQLEHALMEAKAANWSWKQTALRTVDLLFREDGFPRDLAAAARSPLKAAADAGEPTDEYWQLRQQYAPGSDAA